MRRILSYSVFLRCKKTKMKPLHKFLHGLLLVILTISAASCVKAQPLSLQLAKDNFTSFTVNKSYNDISKLTALTPLQYRHHPDFGIRLNDSAQWYEQLDKRTIKTRTYAGPNNKIIIEKGYANLNYMDANGWLRAVDIKLKPSANGWAAEQQEMPVYLYSDASTALSLGNNELMTFNKNVTFNQSTISTSNYTVGDNGMYINDAAVNTDKVIRVGRGRVETDYSIIKPLKLNGDLIISEDIILSSSYTLSENETYNPDAGQLGKLVVKGTDGKVVAELRAPLCYDKKGNSVFGTYHFQKQANGYRLDVDVPYQWLNDTLRQYPVTIDPVVNGPLATYSGGIIPSCVYPNFDTASILVTIPGGITITNFYVQGEYYTPVLYIRNGFLSFQTPCMTSPLIYAGDSIQNSNINTPGWVYAPLLENDLVPYRATCCYKPSCSDQTFLLTMGIARDTIDTAGCNASYFYYDPSNTDNEPFEAYIVGYTVLANSFTLPSSICSNECTFDIGVNINYGVPPYTISHPWSTDTVIVGSYTVSECTSVGKAKNFTLTIPNCKRITCIDSTLSVPPPIIVDACNDTVEGLSPETLVLVAAPNVIATPDTQTICSGTNVNIALSSCLSAATYNWVSSQGLSGTGNTITNFPSNSSRNTITVNYTVTPTANSCAGNTGIFPVKVTPFTININPVSAAICEGNSISLIASGEATIYSWAPDTNLTCTSCANPTANPSATTTYVVDGTNGGACSAFDTVVVTVNPNPTLSVSNDTTIYSGHSVQLFGNTNDSITWVPSTGLSCTNCNNPVATPLETTTYKATATLGNCQVSENVIITVIPPCNSLMVPSGFTPNGDGVNDYLHVLNRGDVTLQEFRVFNRWGEQVYETTNINDRGWDGTLNGKPEPVGTYVYYAQINCQGKIVDLKGNVTLVR